MATDVQAHDAALAERERVVRAIREHAAELRALGVTRLWLFGSVARGDARPESDADVLIDISPDASSRWSISPRSGSPCATCSGAKPALPSARTFGRAFATPSPTI